MREPGFGDKIFKTVGRKACRHYADLLLECSHSAGEAAKIIRWQEACRENPGLALADLPDETRPDSPRHAPPLSGPARPQVWKTARQIRHKRIPGQTLIDLHVHTDPHRRSLAGIARDSRGEDVKGRQPCPDCLKQP